MRLVRVGIVGIGNMGSAHASNIYLDKVKGMKLTAVCDIDAERLQWAKETFKGQVECYDNYHCMLKSGKIDAVIIATPHNLHPLIGCEAFDEGGLATLFWTKLLRTRNYFNYSSYPADFRVFNPLYSTGVR